MKNLFYTSKIRLTLSLMSFFTLILMSCGGGQQKVETEWIDVDTTTVFFSETIYGVCGSGTSMNNLQVLTDTGDTIDVDISTAKEKEMVYGGLSVGDQVAITLIPNSDEKIAYNVINLASLMGDWVTPNPLDGSGYVGISLNEGGIAKGIDQTTLEYRSWRISNGNLLVVSIPDGGGQLEETDTLSLVKITPDSLVVLSHDFEYRYGRRHTMTDDY